MLSKVGMGQSFTVDLTSSKVYPSINCDQTTFTLTNNTGSVIWYRLYISNDDLNWTDISLAGSSQRLNAGASFSINVQSDGFYKIYYASSSTVSLASSSLSSIQTIIRSSPTIVTEVSNVNYATCLNAIANTLSVTANAGSGTISQFAWYRNVSSSNSNGTLTVINNNSSTTDNFIPLSSTVGDLYYYPEITNSNGCVTVGTVSGKITVNPLPSATITGGTAVCQNATSPSLTFTGSNATSPYVFTYTVNSGSSQAITTTSGNSQNITALTNTAGSFTYNLISVKEIGTTTQCSNSITGQSTIVTVNPLPSATISGAIEVCQNASSPNITFTGSNAAAPYVFTYTINSGSSQVITTTSGSIHNLAVPTNLTGLFTYNLISVKEIGTITQCSNSITGQSAIVAVNSLPSATITGGTAVCQNATSPSLTFTGSNATSPYVFTYTVNSGS
ncbi:MAG: hypothetical protein RL387_1556, partial [Bacteroidota bacterium]